ncbi:hypothetical protein BMB171_C1389 [Bacillus thuringiensis BMB171]|nr:hypothetical protein BMB171_C1389 [Bacillus thuringiensis BMB171]
MWTVWPWSSSSSPRSSNISIWARTECITVWTRTKCITVFTKQCITSRSKYRTKRWWNI